MQTGKILFLSNDSAWTYGLRKELIQKLLSENTVYISVADLGYKSALEKLGAKVVKTRFNRRGKNPFSDFKLMLSYCSLLKKIKPDIVLTYTIKPNIYGGMACRIKHTPYVANITGLGTAVENPGILQKITLLLYKFGLKSASCVFFQNKSNMQRFEEKKIIGDNARLIPGSGVNLSCHCCEEYPPDEGIIKFLYVGRIMKDKGINELLEAMDAVHRLYRNVELSIIGGCDENYDTVLKKAEQSGYIHYFGIQKDVHSFYKDSHCTVLPSYHEGTANVLLEAASTGRPVIATRVPGCLETFDEGVSGFGCDAKDAQSLANAMINFIEVPYKTKKQMGLIGRKKMELEYDRQIVIDAYFEEINNAKNIKK